MDNNKIQSQQLQAKKYIEEHDLEKIVSEMLNSVVYDKSKQPIIYMIKYLAGLLSEDERKNSNLIIPDPYPKGKPVVQYPNLDNAPNNALKKHLNINLWNRLKYSKTKHGGGIMNVVKPYDNAKVGVVLTDSDSLDVFSSLLVPIIHDLHELKDTPSFIPTKSPLIKTFENLNVSFHMEYSRNLLGIPLVTIMTKENRKYVETQIKTILSDTKLFSGKYLEFPNDEEEIKKLLFENYVDYSQIDEFLTKSELKKNWPDNRAIFYSDKKDIIILINLIDHLKIISINKDYKACYNNLLESIDAFEKSLSFEIHKNYGYLTTCPTNLGSSLKISAQFKIEKILEKKIVNELLEKYNFDRKRNEKELLIVSENHKMNNKEEDFILNFYEKVNSLCFYERNIDVFVNRLEFKEGTNKSITDCYNNTFNTYKLTLTPEKLSFNSIFDFSVKLPNSHLGIILQSKNYYSAYKNFFDSYFRSEFRHDTNKNQTFNTSFDNYILEIKDKTKLIRTNVKVLRNVDTLSFNTSSNISNNLVELLKILNYNFKGSFAKINETQIISQYLINRFFSEELLNSGFYNEDAMNHVGVFSLEEKPIFIIINDLDHLQFEINISNNDDIIKNITDLYSLIKKLEQSGIKYSDSSSYGILSQCPLYTGTGFNIYSTLKVNTITSNTDKLEELTKNLGFTYKIHDDDQSMIDIIVLNHIGVTEKELFEKWNKIVNHIMENDT